ncbi:MAG: ATP-binding protein [Candidatus Omnitrophica bacterium]|nr:ATP-binding protein [Candidatus Omnitrophota bacterium]MDD5574757.1 ATP-binding protein [Candidatus Omnitrophota bacterium]
MTRVDLSDIHKNILNDSLLRLKGLLRAESASLFLLDGEREELVLNAIFNEQKTQFKGVRQRLGEGIAGSVATQGQAVLVKNIKTDPRFSPRAFRHYHTDSFICVPIVTSLGPIGVISISDKDSGEAFTEDDLRLVCLIAQLASRIVEDQKNMIQLKEENESLKSERTLNRQEQAFLEKFASMGKLAGGIVHEINNPLDAVMRYTNMLIERDLDKSVSGEYLNEIKIGLTRILKITRSLREFSQQLNDNRYQDLVDIHDAVEEALSLFRHNLFGGKIEIEKTFDFGLPKVIDKGLCRVFSNIVKNAIDAMPEGGSLAITTSQDEEFISICFRDTGSGVPDDVKERIFTPFFTTKPIGQGIGLGLPICFEVIQRYGGRIDLESSPGKGSRFTVRLPIKSAFPTVKN